MDDALVFCRFLHLSLTLTLFGVALFRAVLRRQEPAVLAALDGHVLAGQRIAAALALLGGLAWLGLVAASMAGDWSAALDGPTLRLVLGQTFFGQIWAWHLLANVALLVALCLPLSVDNPLRVLLAGAVLASLAPVGHGAMLDGWAGVGLMLNQALHLLCAGAWLGGLLLLAALLYRAPASTHGEALRRFSGVGYLLVVGVAASGLVNVWALVGQWPDPRTSTFGLVLTIKLLLVAGMLALALLNRVALAFREKRLLALRRSVVLEWVCGVAAVAVVSLLGTLSPAG
ncbi:copper homeostasis membrane protein CopD [Pseudomonas citronellolis]|uniref:copper homeostasis membrane protein CopD n=1 Tax=Pseudomonas citronellolis TaxID=53408 RepID=UPI0022BA2948|nr:copper homeostasis membrane protein CopD [Pseudomonas citronellolis]WBG63451.1 copper resistance protein CopD [Pseudomonas citronellolis]